MGEEQNKLKFKDPDGTREIVLVYRDATIDDWIEYQARNSADYDEKDPREVRFKKMFRSQFEAGKRILTGFSASGEGILKGLSMEDPQWKEKLEKKIPQLLITLGRQVFETEDFDAEKNS